MPPRFIEKAKKASCKQHFIGLESINPENLKAVQQVVAVPQPYSLSET